MTAPGKRTTTHSDPRLHHRGWRGQSGVQTIQGQVPTPDLPPPAQTALTRSCASANAASTELPVRPAVSRAVRPVERAPAGWRRRDGPGRVPVQSYAPDRRSGHHRDGLVACGLAGNVQPSVTTSISHNPGRGRSPRCLVGQPWVNMRAGRSAAGARATGRRADIPGGRGAAGLSGRAGRRPGRGQAARARRTARRS